MAALLALTSCVDGGPIGPARNGDLLVPGPSAAVIDGSTTGSGDFYFLPPLVDNPSISGTFNPHLLPTMRVCELSALGQDGVCPDGQLAAYFGEGSAIVGDGKYQISWDTDGSETGFIDSGRFYRLQILVAGTVMGSIDLDPQDPEGPGQSTSGFYAFRVGETIPVKFWLSTEALCVPSEAVLECTSGAVLDETGGTLALDNEGDRLSVYLAGGALPGEGADPITVIIERLDPALFLATEGVECIPLFDAPQFGPCFRITTIPELKAPLDDPALVSICIDPGALDGVNIPEGQEDQLQIVRFGSDGVTLEALGNVPGDCPVQTASLFDVPESGMLRYAALGANALARFVGPQPLAAHGDINLGGLTSSFSRFRFALPGQMIVTAGDGMVLQDNDVTTENTVVVVVKDHEGIPVGNAVVHFSTVDGTLSTPEATTDESGLSSVTWTVDKATPGTKVLTASATGLLDSAVPPHSTNYEFLTESVTATVTVVGPPAAYTATPTGTIGGTAGESVGTVSITVVDGAETPHPVAGAAVTWSGDGSLANASTATDQNGAATAEWTLATTAGGNSLTVTVGSQTHTFHATGAAGPAVKPSFSGDGQEAEVGSALTEPLVVTSADQYGNPRAGDVVTWEVTSGGGSLSSDASVTGASGKASVTWTLGGLVGDNRVTATLTDGAAAVSFTVPFTAKGTVGPAVQPAGSGEGQTGTVGTALGAPLSVTVLDQYDNPRAGDPVTWSGDGTFSATSTLTDGAGVASVTWTLGTGAGPQSATATIAAEPAPFTVTFTATAGPGEADHLTFVSGSGQSALVGATLEQPLTVTVVDKYGNVRAGDEVAWNTNSGTVLGDAWTAADGSAPATWTLGAMPGSQTATVIAGGLPHTFTATARCFDGYGIAGIDGSFGAAEWACAKSVGFTANLSGGDTPAEVYWMNDGANLYMAVRVFQSSFDKVNSLLVDFDNDGDGFVAENDDAIGYEADTGTFLDRYVTKKCLSSSQSGCGAADNSVNGAGAAANDGEWTTYELSHPLTGGGPQDIARSKGEMLGFFLTLRIGNGAQGNTQFPGFRDFGKITIVGF